MQSTRKRQLKKSTWKRGLAGKEDSELGKPSCLGASCWFEEVFSTYLWYIGIFTLSCLIFPTETFGVASLTKTKKWAGFKMRAGNGKISEPINSLMPVLFRCFSFISPFSSSMWKTHCENIHPNNYHHFRKSCDFETFFEKNKKPPTNRVASTLGSIFSFTPRSMVTVRKNSTGVLLPCGDSSRRPLLGSNKTKRFRKSEKKTDLTYPKNTSGRDII